MCPVCIASTAAMVAGAGSTGGILAVCIGKSRRLFSPLRPNMSVVLDKKGTNRLSLFQKMKGAAHDPAGHNEE